MTGLLSQRTSPPYSEYPPEDYSYRRTILAAVIIILAIAGFAIGLVAPGLKSSGNRPLPDFPTISPSPTFMPVLVDTYWDVLYGNASQALLDSGVSSRSSLSPQCVHRLCNGSEDFSKLTVQQRALHYLIFHDDIFQKWALNEDYENVERMVQRYIITLFAFSTGLVKDGDDGKWITQTWSNKALWLSEDEECDWYGILCANREAYVKSKDFVDHTVLSAARGVSSIPGREVKQMPMIIEISLNRNNLQGTLPAEIFKLRHLEVFDLFQNRIKGEIHQNINLMQSLRRLWLHDTIELSGSIPAEIGQLTKLESLFLGGNKLTGTVPAEIENLSNVKTIALNDNKLEGPIPEKISKCVKLERLFLDNNNMDGTIPQEIGQLRSLEDFRLNTNQFTGDLPPQMTLLNNLKVLYLYENKFMGPIRDVTIAGWIHLGEL